MGRPTDYSDELGQKICDVIANSDDGMPVLCKEYDFFPNEKTIYVWRQKHDSFNQMYVKAKQRQANFLAENIVELSKEKSYYIDSEGNQRVDSGSVASTKVQVDAVKFLAAKLAPKTWGDQKQIDELKNQNEQHQEEIIALRAKLAEQAKRDY